MTALIRIDRSWASEDAGPRSRPISFCSRCGQPAEEPARASNRRAAPRVCERCGMGMLLRCARDAMPGPASRFVVARFDLKVSALSQAAEALLGPEDELIDRSLLDVFTSPTGDEELARHVAKAAQRPTEPVVMPVRLIEDGGRRVGTMAARIATCGPPRAALITVEPSSFGRR